MRAVISTIVIAGAALLASACTNNETANVTNTTEVVPTETVNTTDEMVTNVDTAAPMDNATVETNTVDANSTMTNM